MNFVYFNVHRFVFSRPLVLFLKANFHKKINEKKRKQTCIYIYSLCIGSTRMFSKMPKLYWVFRGNDVKGKKEKRGGAMMENI